MLAGRRHRHYVSTVGNGGAGPRLMIEGFLFDHNFQCELGRPQLPKRPSLILHGCEAIVFMGNYF